ncbi:hypothetical protein GCM10017687_88690 [Streptomyces echinatus]
MRMRIQDDRGRPLPDGEPGEIQGRLCTRAALDAALAADRRRPAPTAQTAAGAAGAAGARRLEAVAENDRLRLPAGSEPFRPYGGTGRAPRSARADCPGAFLAVGSA